MSIFEMSLRQDKKQKRGYAVKNVIFLNIQYYALKLSMYVIGKFVSDLRGSSAL